MHTRMVSTGRRPASRAFTLLELIIVVFIIGIILGIAIPGWLVSREIAHEETCKRNRDTADKWLRAYVYQENRTPETIDELVDAGYISPIRCPGGGTYELRIPEDVPEETDTYHPIPYLWCSVHGSEHEDEEDEEPAEEEPDIELEPAPRKRAPVGPVAF
jgi:prepilin-type N-terminal cleavage/methylation domain-containing protein